MTTSAFNIQLFVWLLLAAFFVSLAAQKLHIPYAIALALAGLVIGALNLFPGARLEPSLMLTILLPPLLFETAIHLKAESLHRDWKPITLLTFGGTIGSMFLIAGLAHLIMHLPLSQAALFGALISATDPVSVVAIVKTMGGHARLTFMMEAESLFNDGVSVVLFSVALGMASGHKLSWWKAPEQFLWLILGGFLLGAFIGWIASMLHHQIDDHLVELTLTTLTAYGSYLLAEALHMSGVTAVVATGLLIGNLGLEKSMSESTRTAVHAFWEYAAFVANSLVFLLIGIEVTHISWSSHWVLALSAPCVALAGRLIVYPLILLSNRIGDPIPFKWAGLFWWGGLRGALSMAMVLSLPENSGGRELLLICTFGTVLFSLLIQGLTLRPINQHRKWSAIEI